MGFLIKDSLKKYIKNVMAYSKRIIIFQLTEISININLIQVYVFIIDKQYSAQFYEQLRC